jgi:plasmid stabilization system protein ParE
MGLSGGLTGDNIGVEYAGVVFGIAESRAEPGLIWAGTNDGLLQLTRDNGATWTNVTDNLPDLPEWGSVRSIAPSRYAAGTAYVAIDFHQVNGRDPYVYRTRDYGESWDKITGGIPSSALSYNGENWQPLQMNLPHAPVSGIVIQEHFNDLVISTYGRGFWILDDLTPIQQLTSEVVDSEAHLFEPRAAYRFRPITPPSVPYDDPTVGEDPEYGASINYWVKNPEESAPTITIHNRAGELVRTLEGTNHAGLNRVHWDLLDEPSTQVRLLTPPMYAEHMEVESEGRDAPGTGRMTVLQAPGIYSVKLAVNGTELTRSLEVRKDPNSAGSEADVAEQLELLYAVKEDLEVGADMVHEIEELRIQLRNLIRFSEDEEVKEAAKALEEKLVEHEMNLVDLRLTGQGQDAVRFEAKLLGKLSYLTRGLAYADFRPTDQEIEVQNILHNRLAEHRRALDGLVARDVAELNDFLREKGLDVIGKR